jgi:uncharacterized damage-inducible protein DinB
MTRIEFALNSIHFARGYTQTLLDKVPEEDWFRFPDQGFTHVGWQVGHLAWAEHRLIFTRVAGETTDADNLLPAGYTELFGKGSTPRPDAADYPNVSELRSVFNAVHSRVLVVVPTLADSLLHERIDPPHPAYGNRFEALLFAARHELIHAGQIAMVRRGLGHASLR